MDVFLFVGGGVCFVDGIEVLEVWFGVFVVIGLGVLVWCVCNWIGVDFIYVGYGCLFVLLNGGSNIIIWWWILFGVKIFVVLNDLLVFVLGFGSYLIDEYGKVYLDFVCGLGIMFFGYG